MQNQGVAAAAPDNSASRCTVCSWNHPDIAEVVAIADTDFVQEPALDWGNRWVVEVDAEVLERMEVKTRTSYCPEVNARREHYPVPVIDPLFELLAR